MKAASFIGPCRLLMGLSVALGVAGCSGDARPVLTVVPADQKPFEAAFDAAYFRVTEAGQTDIVLVAGDGSSTAGGETLRSDRAIAVTQIVHLRLLWRTKSAAQSDSPFASNAALEWGAFGATGDTVRYTGSASVVTRGTGADVAFSVYNASVVKSAVTGAMTDPIGTARVEGTFDARRDPVRVDFYLARLSQARQRETTLAP